jgi:hypothetical protein
MHILAELDTLRKALLEKGEEVSKPHDLAII